MYLNTQITFVRVGNYGKRGKRFVEFIRKTWKNKWRNHVVDENSNEHQAQIRLRFSSYPSIRRVINDSQIQPPDYGVDISSADANSKSHIRTKLCVHDFMLTGKAINQWILLKLCVFSQFQFDPEETAHGTPASSIVELGSCVALRGTDA